MAIASRDFRIGVALQPMDWMTAENVGHIGALTLGERTFCWTPLPA